jgi:AcrR family transcriptional regulator
MSSRPLPRPGGRSARVQAAVHQATRELLELDGRDALTVPLIAARAGVTPSTIYRRWGDLADLLADVAVARMRPEAEPADTGTVEGDLQAWAEQFLEEMSSQVGVAMLRDVVAAGGDGDAPVPCPCARFAAGQIAVIVERGLARGEAVPDVDAVMDGVVAPIVYRALFGLTPPAHAQIRDRVAACLPISKKSRPATPRRLA